MSYPKDQVDLGVLGGMGPQATHYFVGELLRAVEDRHQPSCDQDYPNIIVRYACHLPDRTGSYERDDLGSFVAALTRELEILIELGCPQIIIPCITAFMVARPNISQFPIIDIPLLVSDRMTQLYTGARFGVMATTGARLSGVVDRFGGGSLNIESLTTQEEQMLMSFVYSKAKTWQGRHDIAALVDISERLYKRGCDFIIAGCTEVEMCLAQFAHDDSRYIFPLRLAAENFSRELAKRIK